eukprot:Colp12_sorted_trinity150504_noHs@17887
MTVTKMSGLAQDAKRRKDPIRLKPNFITLLWRLVNDASLEKFISWSSNGELVLVHNVSEFQKHVLQRYCNNTLLASLQRQMNLYYFSKTAYPLVNLQRLRRECPDEDCISLAYFHPLFYRAATTEDLSKIKRRKREVHSKPVEINQEAKAVVDAVVKRYKGNDADLPGSMGLFNEFKCRPNVPTPEYNECDATRKMTSAPAGMDFMRGDRRSDFNVQRHAKWEQTGGSSQSSVSQGPMLTQPILAKVMKETNPLSINFASKVSPDPVQMDFFEASQQSDVLDFDVLSDFSLLETASNEDATSSDGRRTYTPRSLEYQEPPNVDGTSDLFPDELFNFETFLAPSFFSRRHQSR